MMNNYYFILKNKTPVEADIITMANWMEESSVSARDGTWVHPRFIGKTRFGGDQVEVSTVFLCINHDHFGGGPPILFETMIFGVGSWKRPILELFEWS